MRSRSFLVLLVLAVGAAACGGAPAPAPGPAPVPAPEPAAPEPPASLVYWSTDFRSIEGWRDNKVDPSLQADLTLVSPGRAQLTENGPQAWGKACTLLNGLDLSRRPTLTVRAAEVAGAKWGLGAAPVAPNGIGWVDAEYKTLLEWREEPGEVSIDLAEATGLSGTKDVWIVLLVANESRSVLFESIKVEYAQ